MTADESEPMSVTMHRDPSDPRRFQLEALRRASLGGFTAREAWRRLAWLATELLVAPQESS
jgi:hypothetical protein